ARVRDRLRSRRSARRLRRGDGWRAAQPRPRAGRAVAAQLADRRDHRGHGLAGGRGGGRDSLRLRLQLLRRVLTDDERQLLHRILDRLHVRPARDRARGSSARTVRAAGMTTFRRVSDVLRIDGAVGFIALVLAAIGPLIFSGYFAHQLLTEVFWYGIAAASLIFLFAYGGMVSLAQV